MGATPCNVTGSMKRHVSLRVGGGASVTRLNTVRTTVCTGPDIVPCPAGSTADADARYTEGSIIFFQDMFTRNPLFCVFSGIFRSSVRLPRRGILTIEFSVLLSASSLCASIDIFEKEDAYAFTSA